MPDDHSRSQRWRERRERFVCNATYIRRRDYVVDVVEAAVAKRFVCDHHASGTFPAARLSVGLFRSRELVGVATFSVPINANSVRLRTGLGDPAHAVDLGRLVLLDDVPGNGESHLVARAMSHLRREKPEVQAVISYADPVPWTLPDGAQIRPGHVGCVYKVLAGVPRGRTAARTQWFAPDGRPVSERALSKIRNLEQGHGYAVSQLVARGAPAPGRAGLRTWLQGLVAAGFLQGRPHAECHTYTWHLTLAAKLAARNVPVLEAPRLNRSATGDVTARPLLAA